MEYRQNFLPLEITYVPDFVKRKAEEELHETEDERARCLKILKALIQGEKIFKPNTDDFFLLRFLRAKKFNCQKSFILLKKYYSHRQKYSSLYANFLPSCILHVAESNIMNFLPHRTRDGCAIWVSKFGQWNPDDSSFEDILKFGLMCLETISQYPVSQISGIVNILDLNDMSYRQLLQVTPSRLLCFVSAVQDSFPLRQKSIHVIHQPYLFSLLFRLLSPLLKDKMKKRIHLHGSNMESLHQHIPPEILPKHYGGTLASSQSYEFYERVLKLEDYFTENQTYGYLPKKS